MSVATLNIKVNPRRMLTEREAAEYCGLKISRFSGACGVVPVAMPGGLTLYDMRDLDRWIDTLKSGAGDSDDDIIGKLS